MFQARCAFPASTTPPTGCCVGGAIAFQIRNDPPPLRDFQSPYPHQDVIVIQGFAVKQNNASSHRRASLLVSGIRS